MGDRMFASEGDSRNVGDPDASRWEAPVRGARWDAGRPHRAADGGDDATAGLARRLQGRLDRHRWLLDRMRSDPLQPEPPGLAELLAIAHRMRRDAEGLLLLCGQDPHPSDGDTSGLPGRLSDVLADAAAAAEEPWRVAIGPAPAATLTAVAATDLRHVLAELVDHAVAVYPGAGVRLGSRVESPAGIVVEVRADNPGRHDPDGLGGRPAMAAAERMAERSRSGIALRRSSAGPGSVATVHCPAGVVTLGEPERVPASWGAEHVHYDPPANGTTPNGGTGNGHQGDALPAPAPASSVPVPEPSQPGLAEPGLAEPGLAEPGLAEPGMAEPGSSQPGTAEPGMAQPGSSQPGRAEPGRAEPGMAQPGMAQPGMAEPGPSQPQPPEPEPSVALPAHSPVDELFGPLGDLPPLPDDDVDPPIFEAIASAWFREDAAEPGGTGDPPDWESPGDDEWQAAAARAAHAEAAQVDPAQLTSQGLPRRRPGNQLVPTLRAPATDSERPAAERVPDRVRGRLSTYQRGLRQGRHRADPESDTDPGDGWETL